MLACVPYLPNTHRWAHHWLCIAIREPQKSDQIEILKSCTADNSLRTKRGQRRKRHLHRFSLEWMMCSKFHGLGQKRAHCAANSARIKAAGIQGIPNQDHPRPGCDFSAKYFQSGSRNFKLRVADYGIHSIRGPIVPNTGGWSASREFSPLNKHPNWDRKENQSFALGWAHA